MSPPDEPRLARLVLEESDADGENEVADCMEETQKVLRDMKARTYGSRGGGEH